MTDVTAARGGGGDNRGFQLLRFADIATLFRRGDIALAVGILVTLVC